MAAKRPAGIEPAELREAFKADLANCWKQARALHPKETPYAFVLHGLEDTPHVIKSTVDPSSQIRRQCLEFHIANEQSEPTRGNHI